MTLRPEQKYRVSMDVKSIIPAPFEVCFNNSGVEKGLGAIFRLISTPASTSNTSPIPRRPPSL
ncbi:MAG: hypothetical protein IKF48_04795 [Oscillospiraceae bacterium]|nr:hypothetical protein [Oscillospiraceae bacterium]